MGRMGINLQLVDVTFITVAKVGKALSLLPAFIMHAERAAQTRLLKELDV